ncbi:membrane protein [Pandoraea aquatica]|uniref:Membrane protein n=1 Tax=Pandoraea aquatica TaxID=2508290 RepID=A0A5E4YVH2_9BURK|nr:hypothetical protein [Pandoraea aquatica]VVE52881.1 membrane protein [Pandoraea aquatica]
MDHLGIWHWLIVLLFTLIFLYPYARIIRRAGFSPWWVLVAFVPLLNIIMIWVFAFIQWPSLEKKSGAPY